MKIILCFVIAFCLAAVAVVCASESLHTLFCHAHDESVKHGKTIKDGEFFVYRLVNGKAEPVHFECAYAEMLKRQWEKQTKK